jgi:CheY-like chemotaxis protein
MPGSNGFEVAEKIRELESKWTPMVFMHSIAKDSYYEKGFAAGADYYLTKPFSEIIFFAALKGIQNMLTMR